MDKLEDSYLCYKNLCTFTFTFSVKMLLIKTGIRSQCSKKMRKNWYAHLRPTQGRNLD
jgi:hypothetical protein